MLVPKEAILGINFFSALVNSFPNHLGKSWFSELLHFEKIHLGSPPDPLVKKVHIYLFWKIYFFFFFEKKFAFASWKFGVKVVEKVTNSYHGKVELLESYKDNSKGQDHWHFTKEVIEKMKKDLDDDKFEGEFQIQIYTTNVKL